MVPFPRIGEHELLTAINQTLANLGLRISVNTITILRDPDPLTGSNWDVLHFSGERPINPRDEKRALEALRQLRLERPTVVPDT